MLVAEIKDLDTWVPQEWELVNENANVSGLGAPCAGVGDLMSGCL